MNGLGKEIKNSLKSLSYKLNYFSGNYRKKIWLIGDGRSGTTWAAGLINWNKNFREMFEPFHPKFVAESKDVSPHLYVRGDDAKSPVDEIAPLVFSGKLVNRRVDAENQFKLKYDGLLIKDIFANLFAFRVAQIFPKLKIILLIRNPFAVAVSKLKMKSAFWMTEPQNFLLHQDLFEDFLMPFENLLLKPREDFIEKQILIWSVIHYVPLLQFERGQILTVFYEDLYRNPAREMEIIFKFIEEENQSGWEKMFRRPSRVAWEKSNVVNGKSPVNAWKKEISPAQLKRGKRILRQFGFGRLYDDDVIPNRKVINNFLRVSDEAITNI